MSEPTFLGTVGVAELAQRWVDVSRGPVTGWVDGHRVCVTVDDYARCYRISVRDAARSVEGLMTYEMRPDAETLCEVVQELSRRLWAERDVEDSRLFTQDNLRRARDAMTNVGTAAAALAPSVEQLRDAMLLVSSTGIREAPTWVGTSSIGRPFNVPFPVDDWEAPVRPRRRPTPKPLAPAPVVPTTIKRKITLE